MKITNLTLYKVPPRWLFLKIDPDEGIAGWGEPVIEGRADAVRACVKPQFVAMNLAAIDTAVANFG